MRIRLTLTGTTPLVMHNVQLSDPDNQWTRAIQTITSKRKKTEDDRREIARLEWFGGLYVGAAGEGPVIPTRNIRRCCNEAAKVRRMGRDVLRALVATSLDVPLRYDGPRDLEELFARAQHVYTDMVRVTGMVQRTRPIFPQWSLAADFELVTETLDLDRFVSLAELAGVVEGLGDNRVNGYGRFTAKVAQL